MPVYPFFLPHAGCPHRCIFCDQRRISGRSRAPTPAEVARQLASWLPAAGTGEVAFYGGSFTLLPAALQEAYLEAVRPYLAAGRAAGVRVSTRPDAVDVTSVDRLAKAGTTTVELGCQSFSDAVLAASRRGHDAAAAERTVSLLRSRELAVGLQLLPGLPGGDVAEARASLAAALALRPDFLRIYPALVLPETALADLWRRGNYRPFSLEEAVECCADLLAASLAAGVPVIRTGLQGSERLDRGAGILAGPHHPAFGQLVRARLWRRALSAVQREEAAASVRVPRAELSDAVGHRRDNLLYFQRRGRPLTFVPDPDLPHGTLRFGGRKIGLLEAARGLE
jgi:histone acetyltransferase (RNA polymerase elongator complex component)